ncbi:hypothetical protein [Nocardiopsis halotolerans]|nr:hypothetical protein [Nocardiopsis halotolerans]
MSDVLPGGLWESVQPLLPPARRKVERSVACTLICYEHLAKHSDDP